MMLIFWRSFMFKLTDDERQIKQLKQVLFNSPANIGKKSISCVVQFRSSHCRLKKIKKAFSKQILGT